MLITVCIILVLNHFGFLLLFYFLILRPSQKRDYDALLTKYNELENKHAKALRDIEALKAENRELRDEIRWLREAKKQLEDRVDSLKAGLIASLISLPAVAMLVIMIMQYVRG